MNKFEEIKKSETEKAKAKKQYCVCVVEGAIEKMGVIED